MLAQTYTNFELLIADDGSEEDIAAVIGQFNDGRIRYIRYGHEGLGKTLNKALRDARHDVIARMDADDIAVPDRLEKQIAVYQQNPINTIVGSWYVLFSEERIKGIVQTNTTHGEIRQRLALHNELVHSGVIFHRRIILENGGYQEAPFEDFEMWLRLKDKARFINIPEPLTLVRIQSQSLSRGDFRNKYTMVYNLLKKYSQSAEALLNEFDIKNTNAAEIILGWQEYFYGSRREAQRKWKPAITAFSAPIKVIIAYFVCFLPEKYFIRFKEARWRFLLDLRKFENKTLLTHFDKLIHSYSRPKA